MDDWGIWETGTLLAIAVITSLVLSIISFASATYMWLFGHTQGLKVLLHINVERIRRMRKAKEESQKILIPVCMYFKAETISLFDESMR